MTNDLTMGRTEWVLLLILSVLWGGSFFFAKIALTDLPPLTLVFLRVAIAGGALWLILRGLGKTIPRSPALWAAFFAMGFINNFVPFSLFFWGQTQIGAGLASIFMAMAPVFTVIVAHLFTRDEKLTAGKLIGVGLGVVGVTLMIGIDIKNGMGFWTILAMIGCLGAALSYGFASVYGRRFSQQGVEPMSVAFGQLTATAIMMAPVIALIDQPWNLAMPSAATIAALLALALFSTALAYVLFFRILAKGGATNISLVAFLIPVSAIILGTLFLGERLNANHVGGMAIIFLGLTALDGRTWPRIGKALRKWNDWYPKPPPHL